MITLTFRNILTTAILLILIENVQCFLSTSHPSVTGFSIHKSPSSQLSHTTNALRSLSFYYNQKQNNNQRPSYSNISTNRSNGSRPPPMLPPPPGDGNNFKGILSTIATIAGLALFFASPLGAIFFAIFNSIFVLSLLLPLVTIIGFQAWSAFNTIQGPCPNCGSNVVVMKDSQGENPSMCINCGSLVRSTQDKKGIELCNAPPSDDFFGLGNNGFGGIFDIFGGGVDAPPVRQGVSLEDKATKRKRETTIIDVDASDD